LLIRYRAAKRKQRLDLLRARDFDDFPASRFFAQGNILNLVAIALHVLDSHLRLGVAGAINHAHRYSSHVI
jgi:hypothetical protein